MGLPSLARMVEMAAQARGITVEEMNEEVNAVQLRPDYDSRDHFAEDRADWTQRRMESVAKQVGNLHWNKVKPEDAHPRLATWDWSTGGVFLSGPTGTGKTHQAVALVKLLGPQMDWDIAWWHAQELIDALRNAQFDRGPVPDLTASIIVLDDLGSDDEPTPFVRNQLLRLVDRVYRSDTQRFLVTSKYDRDGLARNLGPRLADRIEEMCVKVAWTNGGSSWRKQLSPQIAQK